jgi:hypothetical protein
MDRLKNVLYSLMNTIQMRELLSVQTTRKIVEYVLLSNKIHASFNIVLKYYFRREARNKEWRRQEKQDLKLEKMAKKFWIKWMKYVVKFRGLKIKKIIKRRNNERKRSLKLNRELNWKFFLIVMTTALVCLVNNFLNLELINDFFYFFSNFSLFLIK